MIGGAALAATLAVPGIGWAAPAPVQLELVGRTPAQGEAGRRSPPTTPGPSAST